MVFFEEFGRIYFIGDGVFDDRELVEDYGRFVGVFEEKLIGDMVGN